MKTSLFSLAAVALLVGACGGEQGFEQGDDDYGSDDEQLEGEERVDTQNDALSSPGIKGGPPRRVLKGKRSIVCAGIQWQNMDKPAAGTATCNNLSKKLAEFYHKNSRGLLTLVPVDGHVVEVPYNGSHAHLAAAEKMVTSTFNADYYVIPSIFTHPHSGAKISHVKSAQFATATHEVGHLLGLGHAGQYHYSANGTPKLDAYGDHSSPMSDRLSGYLTPPQYYHLGWLPEDEVELFDPEVESYTVKQISDFSTSGLATVMVPPVVKGGRWAFIGAKSCAQGPAKTCVTLHLSNDGGSQKVAESNEEIVDEHFTGLHIKVLGFSGQRARISVEQQPKP
ncbi:MAG: hypothetical protein QM820_59655 [Minicystis sp.]